MDVVKIKALAKNIERERSDLAKHFSERALTEITKNEIAQCSRFTDSVDFLTDMCIIAMENPDEKPVSFYFYTRTRIMAFIWHENEVMNLAAEMQEITQQKPILCLESRARLFCGALGSIMEAYSKDYYSNEDLQKEYCPDNSEVASDWMRYKFGCSDEYEANYCAGCSALETNVGYATDRARDLVPHRLRK